MGRHFAANLMTLLILGLVVAIGIIRWGQQSFFGEGPLAETKIVEVPMGANLAQVSDSLVAAGAINSGTVFRIGARYTGQDEALKFGEYAIPPGASMADILDIIVSGKGISYQVTVAEGLTSFEVASLLNEVALLSGEIGETPPEGSIAPETYAFSREEARADVLTRMQEAQAAILAEAWETRAPGLPVESPEELLILASIIEKETGLPEERGQVASVFVNRLRQGMRLQTDPTVIYGITLGKERLTRGLRRSELAAETPYNTYVISGLPPTPIANPGRAAILAAANPDETDYLFFVADGTGGHAFATTLAEHNRNVAAWRKIEAERAREAQESQ